VTACLSQVYPYPMSYSEMVFRVLTWFYHVFSYFSFFISEGAMDREWIGSYFILLFLFLHFFYKYYLLGIFLGEESGDERRTEDNSAE